MVRGPIRYGMRYSATRQFCYCAAFITPRVLHFSAFHLNSEACSNTHTYMYNVHTDNVFKYERNRALRVTIDTYFPNTKHSIESTQHCALALAR